MPAPPDPGAPSVLLAHGFGFHSFAWGALLEHLAPDYTAQALNLPGYAGAAGVADLAAGAGTWPADAHWVCWSMGGLLALEAIRRGARPRSLALIAASARMVRGAGWPHAIAADTLAQFRRLARADPDAALRRFAALVAHGDQRAREVCGLLRRGAAAPDAATLMRDLDFLERSDLRETWRAHPVAQLNIWGGRDALIPPAATAALRAMRPGHAYLILEQAAHAPMLSQPARVAAHLCAFWRSLEPC